MSSASVLLSIIEPVLHFYSSLIFWLFLHLLATVGVCSIKELDQISPQDKYSLQKLLKAIIEAASQITWSSSI